jgi:methionyl-tRNA formyltransferase
MRIIYMGTPAFAVAPLEQLLSAGANIVAVVTTANKPAGRGQKISESAVKQFADTKNIPVLQPTNLKDPEFLSQLKSYQADLFIVVAFRMLPMEVWQMPSLGTFNLHASLLPQYRGAAPINWAIINAEKETGVTTFFLKHQIDTGDIIFQEKISIDTQDTAGTLHDKLMHLGAHLVVKTWQAITNNNAPNVSQESILASNHWTLDTLKHAPKIFKNDCQIDWQLPASSIAAKIKGLSPYPNASSHLKDLNLKIYEASILAETPNKPAGTIDTDGKTFLRFAAKDAWINILDLQLEGKKRMQIVEFLRGWRLE